MSYYGDQNKGGVNGHYYHVFGTVRPSLFNVVDIFLKDCSAAAVLQDSERRGFVAISIVNWQLEVHDICI